MVTASYEAPRRASATAGADFTAAAPAGGQFRFCKINANTVVGAGPSVAGQYGGPTQISVDPGNVILAGNGDMAFGVIAGKAALGQPVEVHTGGRTVVIAGGAINAGDLIQSDANGAAVAHSGSGHILGIARGAAAAGDQLSIDFDRAGEA